MKYIVYKTTNMKNSKIYIGVHKTRNASIFDGYLGSGNAIKRAVEIYGKENFFREVLFKFSDKDSAYAKERSIVTESFIRSRVSYNLKVGGMGGNSSYPTHLWTEEVRAKVESKLIELYGCKCGRLHEPDVKSLALESLRRKKESMGGFIGDHLHTPGIKIKARNSIISKFGYLGAQMHTDAARAKADEVRYQRYGNKCGQLHTSEAISKRNETNSRLYGNPAGAMHTESANLNRIKSKTLVIEGFDLLGSPIFYSDKGLHGTEFPSNLNLESVSNNRDPFGIWVINSPLRPLVNTFESVLNQKLHKSNSILELRNSKIVSIWLKGQKHAGVSLNMHKIKSDSLSEFVNYSTYLKRSTTISKESTLEV